MQQRVSRAFDLEQHGSRDLLGWSAMTDFQGAAHALEGAQESNGNIALRYILSQCVISDNCSSRIETEASITVPLGPPLSCRAETCLWEGCYH